MKRPPQVLLLMMSPLISGMPALAQNSPLFGQWVLDQTFQGVQMQNFLELSSGGQCVYELRQNGRIMGSVRGNYSFTRSLCNVDGTPRLVCSGQGEMGTPASIAYTINSVGASSLSVLDDVGCRPLTFQRGTRAESPNNEGRGGSVAPATCRLPCGGDAFCATILAHMDKLRACATDQRGLALFTRANDLRGNYCDVWRRDNPNTNVALQRYEQVRPPRDDIEKEIDALAAQIAPQYCRR
jgi:hypothetical protein